MKYTVQLLSESGSFASPYPDDIEYADGMEGLRELFGYWIAQHERVGSDPTDAILWAWRGYLDQAGDQPDFIAKARPRGGMRIERA